MFSRQSLAVIGLLIFFALALNTALSKSPTVDESVHVLRGRTLWQTGEMKLQYGHAPLSHWLIGSLLFTEPTLANVSQLPSWSTNDRITLAKELLWPEDKAPNIERTFLLARLPIIFVGLLIGSMLARWAQERTWIKTGQWNQLVVMLLFAFSPNLLASSALATTDATLTVVYLAAVFTLWRYWQRPSFWRWFIAAAALGLAMATKLTALVLLPVTFILCYAYWPRRQTGRQWRAWWGPGVFWFTLLPVAGLIFWSLYGFELKPVANLPFPVPAATFVNSFIKVQDHVDQGQQAYLLGERSSAGWWYYFIVAFLIKTPVPVLLCLIIALVFLLYQHRWRQTIFLWLPTAALFGLTSYARLNIGYRYLLPMLPFVWLLVAESVPFWQKKRPAQALLSLILTWYALGALRQHPHYLAYFNELVSGSAQGYRYLGDSNLDWGQDLKLLADYVNQTEAEQIYFSYFGTADPVYYGLPPSSLLTDQAPGNFAPANPAPGRYAISAGHIQGLNLAEPDFFDWFRRQEFEQQLGYSIFVYDVTQVANGEWIGHCLDPGPLIDPATAAQLVGKTELRHVYFDCNNSWVFPGGEQPGWYVLPLRGSWPITRYFTENFRSVYTHTATPSAPMYEIYYWDGEGDIASWLAALNSQARLPGGAEVGLPLLVGETVRLIGYQLNEPEWWTVWQVAAPATEPMTVAGHLYTDSPVPAVADGLGYTSEQWRPGDIFIQRHIFAGAADGRYLETGLYNYLTGEHLSFTIDNSTGAFVQLFP
jgi:hypothetical protein